MDCRGFITSWDIMRFPVNHIFVSGFGLSLPAPFPECIRSTLPQPQCDGWQGTFPTRVSKELYSSTVNLYKSCCNLMTSTVNVLQPWDDFVSKLTKCLFKMGTVEAAYRQSLWWQLLPLPRCHLWMTLVVRTACPNRGHVSSFQSVCKKKMFELQV